MPETTHVRQLAAKPCAHACSRNVWRQVFSNLYNTVNTNFVMQTGRQNTTKVLLFLTPKHWSVNDLAWL